MRWAWAILLVGCTYQDPCWREVAEQCDDESPPGHEHDKCMAEKAILKKCEGEPR